jgi:hypothetical protein
VVSVHDMGSIAQQCNASCRWCSLMTSCCRSREPCCICQFAPHQSLLCRLIVAIFQRLAGLSMGLLEVGLLKFYQWVVDTAPPESWSVRTFTYLATGPFRCVLTRRPLWCPSV